MDFRFKKLAWYVMPSVVALALAGCGSDSDNNTNNGGDKTAKFELLLNTGDAATKAASKATAADFANYNLYIWNSGDCTIADSSINTDGKWGEIHNQPTSVSSRGNPVWDLKVTADEGCFNLIVREDADGNGKFEDSDKKYGGDRKLSITAASKEAYAWPTSDNIYPSFEAAVDGLTGLSGASAHIISADTLVWNKADTAKEVRIYHSADASFASTGTKLPAGDYITLTATGESYDGDGTYMDGFKKFTISAEDQAKLKDLLKEQLVAVAVSSSDTVLATTQIQTSKLLDALYADKAKAQEYGAIIGQDGVTFRLWAPTAKSVKLALYNADKTFKETKDMAFDSETGSWSYSGDVAEGTLYRYKVEVYHPMSLKVESYEVTDPYSLSLSMNSEFSQVINLEDPSLKPEGWDDVQAPHKQLDNPAKIVTLETHIRDFSALDESTPAAHRGKYMAFTDTDSVPVKHMKELAENGVTHMHLMPTFDIATVNEDPTKVVNLNDSFKKLCEVNTAVKESEFKDKCTSDTTLKATLESLKAQDSKSNPVIQRLYNYIRGVDSFNWGYDPFHYTVPEGSYATDDAVDSPERIKQFREMVKSIKENIGMNVVMDVVYNHTNAAGPSSKYSVLDKVVPWYYQRLNETTGSVENSTCCSNTAPENAMFAKLIEDSLTTWAKEYKIDAFRFDLMGFHPLAQSKEALEKVREVNPDMFFYAEGWDFGETANNRRFVTTTQPNTGGTGISTYSDRARDAVRGGSPFDSGDGIRKTQGFGNGAYVVPNEAVTQNDELLKSALHQSDLTMLGMAGNLKAFTLIDKTGLPVKGSELDYNGQKAGYAVEPWEVLNYVTKHDNQTLWDNINYKVAADVSLQDRVKMQAISIATAMLGQGIPFTDIGSELLRSKSFERDSYDSGDWYNKVDYTLEDNNFDKGYPRSDKDQSNYDLIESVLKTAQKPTKADMQQMVSYFEELTRLRKENPLLTLGKGEEVVKRVDFRNVGPEQVPGLIVMTIDDGVSTGTDIDPANDAAVVIINSTPNSQTVGDFKDGDDKAITLEGFQLSAAHSKDNSIAGDASFADGHFTVPAWSAAVFVKPQGAARGTGLPLSKKDNPNLPPFGETPLYLKGLFGTQWGTENQMTFSSNYMYAVDIVVTDADLAAHTDGLFQWGVKVADEKFASVNYGKCDSDATALEVGKTVALCPAAKDNLPFSATKAGTYHFVFTAQNKDKPTLAVSYTEPAATCAELPTSSEVGPLGAMKLALRGDHSSWNWDANYQLTYKGNNIYQFVLNNTAAFKAQFKIADDTKNWDNQFYPVNTKGDILAPMEAETVYDAKAGIGGSGGAFSNTSITLPAGKWSFQLKINDGADVSKTGVWSKMSVCQIK